jgi:hypothetical protein
MSASAATRDTRRRDGVPGEDSVQLQCRRPIELMRNRARQFVALPNCDRTAQQCRVAERTVRLFATAVGRCLVRIALRIERIALNVIRDFVAKNTCVSQDFSQEIEQHGPVPDIISGTT